jgi:cystathionine beta-lyase/cystathionine gamma-synthase
MIERIFNSEYLNIGSGISPFNAWLLIRGLRTLPARLERISRTSAEVVAFLKAHPKIGSVVYPFDDDFEQAALAREQMKGACGLFTFALKGGTLESITRFCNGLEHILMAVSWGGHESLIIPKCAGIEPEQFDERKAEHQSIRMYCGLEEGQFLINDLAQALDKI